MKKFFSSLPSCVMKNQPTLIKVWESLDYRASCFPEIFINRLELCNEMHFLKFSDQKDQTVLEHWTENVEYEIRLESEWEAHKTLNILENSVYMRTDEV